MSPVDVTALDGFIAAIEARYGGTVTKGDQEPAVARIPTGSLELDFITGGGYPIGRFVRLWGGYSSGKSLAAWNAVREAQKMGLTCAYYNVEKQYDPVYVRRLGVDTKSLLLVHGTTIEEIGTKLETLLGGVHVHVIDSCSAAISIDSLNANVEDWHVGLGARAWGKVFLRALERFDAKENMVIQIDQARETFGHQGGEHPPGGRLMEHNSGLTLYFKRGAWLFKTNGVLSPDNKGAGKTLSGAVEADGFEIQVRCMKSRVCRPLRSARLQYDFATTSFDQGAEFSRAARYFGVVKTGGSWFTFPDGTKVQGEAKMREKLMADPELLKAVREAVMRTC